MGQYRQLPERIRQLHPTYKTPYVAILFFAGAAIVVIIPGQTTFLGTLYAFGATLSFTVAHISVIRLRQVDPDPEGRRRTWKPPGNLRIRGVQVPLTAIFGGFGTAGAFIVAMALDPVVLAVGGGWMVVGLIGYTLYRRSQGLPLRETVKVESLTPLGVEEVEYRSVLVAFDADDPFSEEAVTTAMALASRRRRAIHVLSLVTVPSNLPLDANLDGRDSAARSKLEQAKLICGQRVSGSIEHVRLGQAGNAIVAEAKSIDAAAIVMPLRYRAGAPLYGKTLQTVLAKRPCRVIVAAHPGESADGSPVGGAVV
jgi:APA family basic amino acid/polyamine antiporter